MIACILGEVLALSAPKAVLLTQGGLGYEVHLTAGAFTKMRLGSVINVPCTLVIKDDAHTLYGFEDDAQKTLFGQLIKTQGVGAKMAMALLSSFDCADLINAICNQDTTRLCQVPGVGKRMAQRLILELKDALPKTCAHPSARGDVERALLGLGYSKDETQKTLDAIPIADDTQALLKAALAYLARF